jgi:hypothetical protein
MKIQNSFYQRKENYNELQASVHNLSDVDNNEEGKVNDKDMGFVERRYKMSDRPWMVFGKIKYMQESGY